MFYQDEKFLCFERHNFRKIKRKVTGWRKMFTKYPTVALYSEHVKKLRCTILDAWGWCTGTTQRDDLGREEGGGFRMGNTCIPVADSFRCLAKPIQYCKV